MSTWSQSWLGLPPDIGEKKLSFLSPYFQSLKEISRWEYNGLIVALDPTLDFKGNSALIRWKDINEGFNDKLIVNSLVEFKSNFKLIYFICQRIKKIFLNLFFCPVSL